MGEESLLLRCVQCGKLYPGSLTTDGMHIPDSPASGSRCHECGGEKFKQVTLSSD